MCSLPLMVIGFFPGGHEVLRTIIPMSAIPSHHLDLALRGGRCIGTGRWVRMAQHHQHSTSVEETDYLSTSDPIMFIARSQENGCLWKKGSLSRIWMTRN